jgi:hypothetical protein
MKQMVYRGVEYGEALRVLETQRYRRAERRTFANGASATAVFGSGVYLVDNPYVAAQYAICHAETTWDRAAVLKQELEVDGLFRLDQHFGENELRDEALRWRHTGRELKRLAAVMEQQQWREWKGEEIRAYLLDKGFAGIRYRMREDLTYYVSYVPEKHISQIRLFAVFAVTEIV